MSVREKNDKDEAEFGIQCLMSRTNIMSSVL